MDWRRVSKGTTNVSRLMGCANPNVDTDSSRVLDHLLIDMLSLNNPPLTQHISVPRDLSQLSCEAYSAGIVEGVLEGLDMVGLALSIKLTDHP
jgi:hypothetical protein